MMPAARVMDMHMCPMQTPAVPPIPHVGGPVLPSTSVPTVLIGCLPVAGAGQQCVCVGPPDLIVGCSKSVLVNKRPLSRMGDSTAHGGVIVMGCPSVLVGG
ncbi:PAAR domain-containing protein [Endozoicomonas atrinae]|uniref:PAAR domain-containing protein n=1 Tax=Endozoicomonas atrinae TaxID=1333660 RepID=UPI0009F2A686|nr:PAAR domain-containing protein [Endozoicomonas atrinae]